MKVKTSELTGAALDYAVAMCEDIAKFSPLASSKYHFAPSKSWQQGGPIIEQNSISIIRCDDDYATDSKGYCTNKRISVWTASIGQNNLQYSSFYPDSDKQYEIVEDDCTYGPTPLIAAMRCYVASKMGEEIEIPKELED